MKAYARIQDSYFVVGNDKIERRYVLSEQGFCHDSLVNKESGYVWTGEKQMPVISVCGFSTIGILPTLTVETTDSLGCSVSHLEATLTFVGECLTVRLILSVYEDSPFISTRLAVKKNVGAELVSFDEAKCDLVDAVTLFEPHVRLSRVTFVDQSDYNDTLVTTDSEILYARTATDREGQMFLLSPILHDEQLLLVKEAPCKKGCVNRVRSEFSCVPKQFAGLYGTGVKLDDLSDEYYIYCYGATVGVGKGRDLFRDYRTHYKLVCRGDNRQNLFTMSNTWGDRSRDKALCEAFMIKEGECAKKLGVDIVQLDDGWQTGLTAGSAYSHAPKVWSTGFYRTDSDFWKIHEKKFPRGFAPFCSDAYHLGIWFSLDGDNDYAACQKDAERMLEIHRAYQVSHFKIDGISLLNKRGESRFTSFFQTLLKESGGDISFNMDITNGIRFGYLYEKQLGTLFVENRYSDTVSYYPHATLRNLWMLSRYIPSRKMQFEVLNPRRNKKLYGGDPLAPNTYDADYLFASVMVSNPLIWMEMQHLRQKDSDAIAKLSRVWRKERKAIFDGEVIPIGEEPSGASVTGFQVKTDEKSGYFILFREVTDRASFVLPVECDGRGYKVTVLASNAGAARLSIGNGRVRAYISKKRGYVFAAYEKE